MKVSISRTSANGKPCRVLNIRIDGKRKRKFFDSYTDAKKFDVLAWLAKAGFKSGDLVQKINGKPVKTVATHEQLTKRSKGKPMVIIFVRGQQEKSLTLP